MADPNVWTYIRAALSPEPSPAGYVHKCRPAGMRKVPWQTWWFDPQPIPAPPPDEDLEDVDSDDAGDDPEGGEG